MPSIFNTEGYKLIDWQCNPKFYADQLGVKVWRKTTDRPDFYLYHIILTKDYEEIARYWYIHWDFISVMLEFAIRLKTNEREGAGR